MEDPDGGIGFVLTKRCEGSGVRDGGFAFAFGDVGSRGDFATEGSFLRSYGQVEAYMKDQAGLIERDLGSIPKAELDSKLSQIGRLAPDLHRVHYLKYLSCLHHEDYPGAMSSLHRYFDYCAGRGSMVSTGHVSDASIGRFQAGLLSLGSMHTHFGHVSQALQALNETVRIAQQNNDDVCLAHALAALCYLLSDVGVTADTSVVGVGDSSLGLGLGPPLVVQQQLLLLLKRCHKRALELKLPHLVAFSRLALAKFDLKVWIWYEGPILHGLCRLGYATRVVLSCVCGDVSAKFEGVQCRFLHHVYMGDTAN